MASAKGAQNVGGYIRVSRIGGRSGEGFISPDVQREAIGRYATELGYLVPDDAWFDDQDFSGGNLDRPAWERLVARIESHELAGVIVYCTDRFARNVPDGATEIRRIVDEERAFFGSALERMDAATDQGRYMLQQFLNNAELQLNTLKSGWHRAKERAIARGAHIGPTPLGYARIPKGAERSGCLEPIAEWKPLIRGVFREAAKSTVGNKTLANYANEHWPRPDGRRWTPTTVGHVIANRVYLGEVAYRPSNDDFEPLMNPDAHRPMIEQETWDAAQRKPGVQKTSAGPASLLGGLVRCAGCRYRMSASRGGQNLRVYRCIGEHGSGKCSAPATIKAERIESWVLDHVRSQWQTRIKLRAHDVDRDKRLEEALTELEGSERELQAFATDLKARELLGDGYHPAMTARAEAVAEARAAVDALSDRDERIPASLAHINWRSLTRPETREVLAGAIDAVFIRRGRGLAVDERAVVVWRGDLDEDVPRRGRPAPPIRPFTWPSRD